MSNILKTLEEKVSPKYLIYLKKNEYKLFKSIEQDPSSISPNLIDNKIFEVLDTFEISSEILYLVGLDNEELGWVKVSSPILILNSFLEKVSIIDTQSENSLNEILNIENVVNKNKLYISKYICNYRDKLYSGLEDENEFIGFYPIDTIDFGNYKELKLKFKQNMTKVYHSEDMTKEQMIITDDRQYKVAKYYKYLEKGAVKIGTNVYWFRGEDILLDESELLPIKKKHDEYYLEHLIQSMKLDKSMQVNSKTSSSSANREYVDSLKERVKDLKVKNEKHLNKSREMKKKLNEQKLELKRKNSKIDYLERLDTSKQKKINYYEERNKNLQNRVELLENKLLSVSNTLKKLRNSKLVKLQSKFLRK